MQFYTWCTQAQVYSQEIQAGNTGRKYRQEILAGNTDRKYRQEIQAGNKAGNTGK